MMPFGRRLFVLSTVAILGSQWSCTSAGWIDPDTPADSMTTEPLDPRAPPAVKATSKTAKKERHNPSPTATPTEVTDAPTDAPTVSPKTYSLVFSDEFNTPDRSFEDGNDPRWTAMEKNDYTNDALHYYSAKNVATNENGQLVIKTKAADTDVVGFDDVKRKDTQITKHFQSGMLQSWNKFCFTGGIIEAEVELPGKHNVGGLWPAFWLLGNLARHTYVGSSAHIWPWSSTKCTKKSSTAQHVSGCSNVGHYGMAKRVGRGAPEIDIFEVQPGNIPKNNGPFLKTWVGQPFMSTSFQVAPGRPAQRPGAADWPGPGQWYEGLAGGNNSALNILFYGTYNHFADDVDASKEDYWSDAISYNHQLDATHFNTTHKYRLEWEVPDPEKGTDGHIRWFLDGKMVMTINGTGIKEANQGAEISSEPTYIILNTAVSSQWGFPTECPANCPCKTYDCSSTQWQKRCGFSEGFCDMMTNTPPEYKINYIRVYQDPENEKHKVGCSTPERPTRKYILAHEDLYKTDDDVHPLKGVQVGRGPCTPGIMGNGSDTCGGVSRGTCTKGGVCECKQGWTGAHCLAHRGYDDIIWDAPDTISDLGFEWPALAPHFLVMALCSLGAIMLTATTFKRHMDGWMALT